jgi:hypothetical protein
MQSDAAVTWLEIFLKAMDAPEMLTFFGKIAPLTSF